MIDSVLSEEIMKHWRECIYKTMISGISDPKTFPIIPVYVNTKDGIQRIESIQLYPEMNGILLNIVNKEEEK